MPMINFQCTDCGEKFTELVYNRNKDSVKCPGCGAAAKQIYEGKCNSLKSSSDPGPVPASPCHTCGMGCKH